MEWNGAANIMNYGDLCYMANMEVNKRNPPLSERLETTATQLCGKANSKEQIHKQTIHDFDPG
jgi:hypothetical protein